MVSNMRSVMRHPSTARPSPRRAAMRADEATDPEDMGQGGQRSHHIAEPGFRHNGDGRLAP